MNVSEGRSFAISDLTTISTGDVDVPLRDPSEIWTNIWDIPEGCLNPGCISQMDLISQSDFHIPDGVYTTGQSTRNKLKNVSLRWVGKEEGGTGDGIRGAGLYPTT